ncbi:MAG: hypothetical protein V2I33_25095 [Kangiellaceae bacterium]|nr:hypothetical protein [Kangiellaceae bacterium]
MTTQHRTLPDNKAQASRHIKHHGADLNKLNEWDSSRETLSGFR